MTRRASKREIADVVVVVVVVVIVIIVVIVVHVAAYCCHCSDAGRFEAHVTKARRPWHVAPAGF